jgi:glutathione S-transferase
MKLYDSGRAPNPRRVRIFLAEKGITVPAEQVDLAAQEQKSPAFTALNPLQRVPVLALDDGTVIAESMAICRYFERLRPEPPLFGRGPKEEALVEMWNRRMDLNLLAAVSNVFRHMHPAMKELEDPQIPEWAEVNKPRVIDFLGILDVELKDQLYVVGDHFTVADITGLVAVDFMKPAHLALPEELVTVRRWHAQVAARPSAKA